MPNAEQNAWVRRVLGVSVNDASVMNPADGGNDPGLLAELAERLVIVRMDAKRFGAAELGTEIDRAATLVSASDPAAELLLGEIEDRMAVIAAARRRAQAQQEVAKAAPGKAGLVAVAKARLLWGGARDSFAEAAGNLVAAARALLASEEVALDPRATEPDTLARVEALGARLPDLAACGEAIEHALDASGADRAELAKNAVKAIDTYLAKLNDEPELAALQTEAGSFPSLSLITSALNQLKSVLADGTPAGAEPQAERNAA